jgi:hypothetical protein
MISITLGPDEIAIAEVVGSRRYQSCRAADSPTTHYPHDETTERQDHHAAGAELAACIALGGYWDAIRGKGSANRFADLRVGRRGTYQVRSTIHERGFMPVYPEDEGMCVFVVGSLPHYSVIGMIDVALVKREVYWSTTNPRTGQPLLHPCFVVEQRDLNELTELAA